METPNGAIYSFGPFQANPASGELFKQGKRLRLQEQPFRLLIILLENAGEVVLKAEIQKQIWDENTYVDFDSSLRVAVGKLREALGDNAASPHYIESVPKRGYRFLGTVESSVKAMDRSIMVAELRPTPIPGARLSGRLLAIAGLVVIIAAVIGYVFLSHRNAFLTGRDLIVLADFDNKTRDPIFDDTLRQGLAIQLEQSPFLSLVSEDRLQQTLQRMGRPSGIRLTPAIAREICERTGSAAVLEGSIGQIGSMYLITLEAINCRNGESIASAESQASNKNEVLKALGKTASEIRRKLGESLRTIQTRETPLQDATTTSLEALKAFSEGRKVLSVSGDAAAIPFYKHAIELDPNFALPYAYLGIAHIALGEPQLAARYTQKAYELRLQTSEPEKYFISAVYFKEVIGDMQRAEQVCRVWIQAYPRSEMPHTYLAGAIYPAIGQYGKGAEEAREALRLNPDDPAPNAFLILATIAENQTSQARAAYEQAQKRKLDSPFFHEFLYQAAFLENNPAEMERQAAFATDQPGVEDILLSLKADTAAYSGHLSAARELSRRASDSAARSGEDESAAGYLAQSALREALFGNRDEAQKRARLALGRSTGRDVQYAAALTLTFAGDSERAGAIVNKLASVYPEDTLVQFNYLPTLRANLAVNRGKPEEAIDSLEKAASYELGGTTGSSLAWNAMYPVFVRGQAYLAAQKGREAAAEFQKILDHRGVVVNEPIGALAHLGLGRAYTLEGETAKGRAAYQDFFTLWKAADQDIPVFRHAKAEYEKLK